MNKDVDVYDTPGLPVENHLSYWIKDPSRAAKFLIRKDVSPNIINAK